MAIVSRSRLLFSRGCFLGHLFSWTHFLKNGSFKGNKKSKPKEYDQSPNNNQLLTSPIQSYFPLAGVKKGEPFRHCLFSISSKLVLHTTTIIKKLTENSFFNGKLPFISHHHHPPIMMGYFHMPSHTHSPPKQIFFFVILMHFCEIPRQASLNIFFFQPYPSLLLQKKILLFVYLWKIGSPWMGSPGFVFIIVALFSHFSSTDLLPSIIVKSLEKLFRNTRSSQ